MVKGTDPSFHNRIANICAFTYRTNTTLVAFYKRAGLATKKFVYRFYTIINVQLFINMVHMLSYRLRAKE